MESQNLFPEGSKNTALLRAIESVAAADNPQDRADLYRALLDSVLLVPVAKIPKGLDVGTHTLPDPVEIAVLQLTDGQQRQVTPAFTDEETLSNWDPNTPFVGLKAGLYFRLVKDMEISAIVINPFDPARKMLRPGCRLMRFEFEALAESLIPTPPDASGAMHMIFAQRQSVTIGHPADSPSPEILEALVTTAQGIPEIKELYLFQMGAQEDDAHTVVGIDWVRPPNEQRAQTILSSLAQAVHPMLAGHAYLDFIVLKDSLGDAIRQCGKKLLIGNR